MLGKLNTLQPLIGQTPTIRLEQGLIMSNTTVIESSSGNLAIELATLCKRIGIRFVPVIDPNINPTYETNLETISHRVEKVTERDYTGGFLLTRLE